MCGSNLGSGEGQDGLAHVHGLIFRGIVIQIDQLDLVQNVPHAKHKRGGGPQKAGAAYDS